MTVDAESIVNWPASKIYMTSCVRSLGMTSGQAVETFHLMPGVATFGSMVLARVETIGADERVEDQDGRAVTLLPGDHIIGVVGNRYSTMSLYGGVPEDGINVPTTVPVDLLSTGGVMGMCESWPSYVGYPTKLQVLGLIAQDGKPVNLLSQLHTGEQLTCQSPLLLIVGTAASVGKTTFATKLIDFLIHTLGWRAAATKLAGAGEYADLLSLRDVGANPTWDFVDEGLPTTYRVPDQLAVPTIKRVLNRMGEEQPDVIVAELGGDILGASVPDILADPEIRAITKALILVPSDMLAAYGTVTILQNTAFPAPIYLGQPIRNPKASRERARLLLQQPMFDCMNPDDLSKLVKNELGWRTKSESTSASLSDGQELSLLMS
ncbi:MAG TPA: hypothetical protein VJ761_23560 [Ktedonobacteraceae bacterium]|nr:hypothetical protein [Ktedonobacteraceae bacterium]